MNYTITNNPYFIELLIGKTGVSLVSDINDFIYLSDLINSKFIYKSSGFYYLGKKEENVLTINIGGYSTLSEAFEISGVTLTKEIIEDLNKSLRTIYLKKSFGYFNKDIRFNNYLINKNIGEILELLIDASYLYKADDSYLKGNFIYPDNKDYIVINNLPDSKFSIIKKTSLEFIKFYESLISQKNIGANLYV